MIRKAAKLLPLSFKDWLYRIRDISDNISILQRYGSVSWSKNLVLSFRIFFNPHKTILFYPDRPWKGSIEYKMCVFLGYAITRDPHHPHDIVFKFRDATYFDPQLLQSSMPNNHRIINQGSLDISKHFISKSFAEVFGYELEVDPTQYYGLMVEKSNANGAHDGHLLQGPLLPEKFQSGQIYQKAINNNADSGRMSLDYRVPIHGDEIPLIYLKYRPMETRFSNKNVVVELRGPRAVFSDEEIVKMRALARKMGVDYGELDVLRDKDNRIYVVDVNNTPHGPPNGLSKADCKVALHRMAKSFQRLLN